MDELHFPRQAPWDQLSSGQDYGFQRPHQYRQDSEGSVRYEEHEENGEDDQENEQVSEQRIHHPQNNYRNASVISDAGSREAPRVVTPQRRMPIRRTSHLARREGDRGQQEHSRSPAILSQHSRDDLPRGLYSPRHVPPTIQSDPYGDTVPLWMPALPPSPRQMLASKQYGRWDPDRGVRAAGAYDETSLMVPRVPPIQNFANSKSQRSMRSGSSVSSGSKKTMHRIIEPEQSGFRRLVQRFDFKWYGVNMGTGIVSIILFTFSETYEDSFNALRILSYVFYFMNLGIFGVIFLLTVLRYLMYPKLFIFLISDPGQSMYLGTFPMGFAIIVTMTVNVAVKRLGGPTWPLVAWGLWWFDAIISVGVALTVPLGLMTKPKGGVALSTMTAGWLLPAVAPIVAAATGAGVAAVLTPYQALITIMVSLALLGLGLPMALIIITIYFHRLTTHGLPPLEHMVSVFLPLGPLGQGGYAAQKLGAQALKTLVAMDSLPAVGSLVAGQVFYVVGFIFAWILWGFGTIWLFFAVFSVCSRKFPFGMGWWAFTFPLGVYAMSTLTLGQELPSVFMRIVGTILGIQVMINWLFLAVVMFSKLMSGRVWDVFKAPELYGNRNQRWEYE